MSRQRPQVVVVGGGLAGIAAATALAETGVGVTLLEARPRLGGATCSFRRGDLVVDNGQHVFLRCCTAYRGLLDRLGVSGDVTLQSRFDATVLAPHGRARLRAATLPWPGRTAGPVPTPGPLQMGAALTRYGFLSFPERAAVTRAALAMRRLDPADPRLDGQRFGDWLAMHGQSERIRRVLWDLFTVSSLNVPGDEGSLALAATVVKTALLGAAGAADIGVPALPLGELHGAAAAALLRRLGATVRLGAKVAAIVPAADVAGGGSAAPSGYGAWNGNGAASAGRVPTGGDLPEGDRAFTVRLARAAGAEGTDVGVLSADGVVLAVPPPAAAQLVPTAAGAATADWLRLGAAPIVNVHVVYDRRVTDLPFAAAVDSPVQWVFDRTRISGLAVTDPRAQYLAVSLSAADEYVDVPAARLRERFLPALADLLPAAREARVVEFFVTRERRATFRQTPGCGALRPRAATALPGCTLAGAWTDTGWPDTMEGAVRSGLNAAIELRRTFRGSVGPDEPDDAAVLVGAGAGR